MSQTQASRELQGGRRPSKAWASQHDATPPQPQRAPAPQRQASWERNEAGARAKSMQAKCGHIGGDADEVLLKLFG